MTWEVIINEEIFNLFLHDILIEAFRTNHYIWLYINNISYIIRIYFGNYISSNRSKWIKT